MPQSNDSTEIDRSIPATDRTTDRSAPRSSSRIVAALVDVVVVAVPTILVAVLLTERFTIVEDAVDGGGRPRFSDADQLRINEIDEGFNRALRIGDTVFTLSGPGWWLVIGVLMLLTTFVFVLVPGKLGRRSPGQSLLSMPEGDDEDAADAIGIVAEPASADWLSDLAEPADKNVTDTDAIDTDTTEKEAETLIEATPSEGSDAQEPVAISDATNLPETLSAAEALATTPVTLADPSEYLDWERRQHAASEASDARATASSFDTLALAESSLAESPLNASTMRATGSATATATATAAKSFATTSTTAASTTAASPDAETAAAAAPTAEEPIWSDMWKAWLYWDPASDRWFRHDADNNSWKPLT